MMAFRQCVRVSQSLCYHPRRYSHNWINEVASTTHCLSSHEYSCQRSNSSHIFVPAKGGTLPLQRSFLGYSNLMPAVVRNYTQDNSRSKSSKSWTKKKQKSVKVQIRGPMSVRELASAAGIPQGRIYYINVHIDLNSQVFHTVSSFLSTVLTK